MLQFREAAMEDAKSIAEFHAASWRKYYRGIWPDAFLDNDAYNNRLKVWQQRLTTPASNQYILLAEKDKLLCGFACIYLNDDAVFGTLLDNLHVSEKVQGLGIGKALMKMAAAKMDEFKPGDKFYLWVLEENHQARKFYEHLGGKNFETLFKEYPEGTFTNTCRYVWASTFDIKITTEI
jgi:ribosomal protein S18 acetylase RimI-like enzyme